MKEAIYRDLAKYYDLIYHWKDYPKEANKIKNIIDKYKKSDWNLLLEIACGTWEHLKYFQNDFVCMWTDINQWILDVAKSKLKKIDFKKVDMVNFDLKKKFDVILCLFSSIGYIKTYKNLEKTLKNFAMHIKNGGVVIIEPWFTKDSYKPGKPHMKVYDGDDLKISRLTVSQQKDNLSIMDMHYLIAEKNKKVKHFVDRHEMGLFDVDQTLEFMKKYWFKAKFLKNGLMKSRWLFVWVKK